MLRTSKTNAILLGILLYPKDLVNDDFNMSQSHTRYKLNNKLYTLILFY